MCKSKIEKAAKIDGVSKAEWNVDTKVLTLAYNPSQLQVMQYRKALQR